MSRGGKRLLKANWQSQILPGVLVIVLVMLARVLGLFQSLEWKALDYFLYIRPAEPQDKRVLIVGIDEQDIQQAETYPIPDRDLAALLRKLSESNPRAIGLDIFRDLPVEPGYAILADVLETSPNIFGIEKIMGSPIPPPPTLPPDQVGFVDLPLDQDGFVRRTYLGSLPPSDHPEATRFRFSLALRLAKAYLAEEQVLLDNGRRNPDNMAFGDTEFFQFQPNSGGYVRTKSAGVQILINVRSGKLPFRRVSMDDVLTGQVKTDWIRDRIILIGITSLSTKDLVNSAAVKTDNPGLFYGIEMQAHITSQILSAALDNRPMLQVWSDGWEYLWITLWGSVGLLLARCIPRPLQYVFSVGVIGLGIVGISFLSLWLGGWWIPVVPTLIGFSINGLVLPGFYLYDQTLRSRIDERQRVIEQTYDAIHNGPLQTLGLLLKKKEILEPYISCQLESLNRELREVYNRLQQESLPQEEQLQLGSGRVIDLRNPLHEALYEVYAETLRRDFPGFDSLKFKVVKFEPLQAEQFSSDDKRSLCRFLEEALCNVGKHAVEAKRLTVSCLTADAENLIRVEDNGKVNQALLHQLQQKSSGRGTQQAEVLAQRLKGTFQRSFRENGTICELRWPLRLPSFWELGNRLPKFPST